MGSVMGTPSLSGAMDSSVMYLLETAHSSFCSRRMAPTSRVMAASLGKIPTTLVRRLTSAWSRSIGFVECNFWRCSLGKAHVGEDVVLGFVHENCQLGLSLL